MNARLILVFISLFGCVFYSHAQKPVIIDVDQALKDQRSLKLSQIIDHVEMIELEGKKGAYLKSVYWVHVDDKHIIIGGKQPDLMLVFGRDGKFQRQIGATGQGPGEYAILNAAAVNPDGQVIILSDPAGKKLIACNPEGKLLKEIILPKDMPSRVIDRIEFVDNENFAVQWRRPGRNIAGYNRVQFFNTRLEPGISILPVTDSVSLSFKASFQCELIPNPTGMNYVEMIENTVYHINAEGKVNSLYQFRIANNPLTPDLFGNYNFEDDQGNVKKRTYVWSAYITSAFVISNGYSAGKPILVVHDKRANASFSIPVASPCFKADWKRPTVENDIFGIEPVYFDKFQPGSDFYITTVAVDQIDKWQDWDCLKKLKVKQPEIRDRIAKIGENQTGEENVIIVLMHLK